MSTDVLIGGKRHDNDVRKGDFDTKDMEEVELVITDEDVKEVKDDTFRKAQEEDGDKRSSSNTSGIFGIIILSPYISTLSQGLGPVLVVTTVYLLKWRRKTRRRLPLLLKLRSPRNNPGFLGSLSQSSSTHRWQ